MVGQEEHCSRKVARRDPRYLRAAIAKVATVELTADAPEQRVVARRRRLHHKGGTQRDAAHTRELHLVHQPLRRVGDIGAEVPRGRGARLAAAEKAERLAGREPRVVGVDVGGAAMEPDPRRPRQPRHRTTDGRRCSHPLGDQRGPLRRRVKAGDTAAREVEKEVGALQLRQPTVGLCGVPENHPAEAAPGLAAGEDGDLIATLEQRRRHELAQQPRAACDDRPHQRAGPPAASSRTMSFAIRCTAASASGMAPVMVRKPWIMPVSQRCSTLLPASRRRTA